MKDAKQRKTLTSKHKLHHPIQYQTHEPLVQEQRNPSESSLRQQESNSLEIEGTSVHKGMEGQSMAEQKEQTEHPDLHPWGSTRRPTLPRRNRRSNFSTRRGERRRNRFGEGSGAERGRAEVKRWVGENRRLKPTIVAKPTISRQLLKIITKVK